VLSTLIRHMIFVSLCLRDALTSPRALCIERSSPETSFADQSAP
jgi:hypothetical protein